MAKKQMKVDDKELIAAIHAEYSQCSVDGQDTLSYQRVQAGYSYQNRNTERTVPTTNMSEVRMLFTPPAIQTLVAHQSKIFCSNKDTVVFAPNYSEEMRSAAAKQLGSMVNVALHQKNNGYEIITNLLRSAATYKNGVAKVSWLEKPEIQEEMLEDIDPAQLEVIIQQREAEGWEVSVTEKKETTVEVEAEGVDELGMPTMVAEAMTTGSYTLRMERMKGKVHIDVLPPEEFMINEGTTSINDDDLTRWVAHRKLMFRGDVQVMFPDVDVDTISSASELGDNYEKEARHYFDATYEDAGEGGYTQAVKTIEVVESWIRIDRDGDGYPEWRHVFTAGNELLMDEEWFGPLPFASYTFFPVPHKFYGLSVYDRLHSLEEQATGLMRSAQDFTRLANTFRLIAKEDSVDPRTLNSGRPGVIPASKSFNPREDIFAVPTPSGSGLGATVPLLQELRQQVIAEIGIDVVSGQVSTDIEKSGNDAAKTAMAIDAASVKMESYARMFADGTLKDIIWLIAHYLCKNKDSVFVKDLLDCCSPGQPFLAAEYGLDNMFNKSDLKAKVGLGHQTGQQKIQAAQILGGLMAQLAADPTQAMYNLVLNAAEGLGFADPAAEIGTLETWMMKAQQVQQAQQAQIQQAQAAQQQAAASIQLEQQKFEFEKELKMMIAQGELEIKRMEAEAEVALKKAKAMQATADSVVKTQEADAVAEATEVKVIV